MREGDQRVVVTGMGALTPIATTCLLSGTARERRSGITRITLFDT